MNNIEQLPPDIKPHLLSPEKRYRYEERLGILCGSGIATQEQMRIAWNEVTQKPQEKGTK